MSRTVQVDLGDRSYDINIGAGVPVGTSLEGAKPGRVFIITDSNVAALYLEETRMELESRGFAVRHTVVPAGEPSKELKAAASLYSEAIREGLDRSSIIVALGGGMIGDLAGFVAATFLRGIRFIQVPTTLLAMVDSSIGGKTGVNLPEGKNLVGAFHQPVEVTADLDTLTSLPEREYRSGLAEVVKYGVIWDAVLFSSLEKNADALLKRDPSVLEDVVARCCEIKAEIVAMDEKEEGVRAVLNFGHTMGHSLEKASGYSCLHGEAVAAGMVFAGELSVIDHGFSRKDCDRLTGLLNHFGLPIGSAQLAPGTDWKSLRASMSADKKTHHGVLRLVLAKRLGEVVFGCEVADTRMDQAWVSFSRCTG